MKALVRVAKIKSNLKFNQLKAYRALNLSDMHVLLNRYSDIDMLIFEEVQPDEIEAVKMLADDFAGKTYTFGQIKIDGIDNYTCLSDIQDALDTTYSLSTRTYGRERAKRIYTEVYDESGNLLLDTTEQLQLEDKENSGVNAEDEASKSPLDEMVPAETSENINIIVSEDSNKTEQSSDDFIGDITDDITGDIFGGLVEPAKESVVEEVKSEEADVAEEAVVVEEVAKVEEATVAEEVKAESEAVVEEVKAEPETVVEEVKIEETTIAEEVKSEPETVVEEVKTESEAVVEEVKTESEVVAEEVKTEEATVEEDAKTEAIAETAPETIVEEKVKTESETVVGEDAKVDEAPEVTDNTEVVSDDIFGTEEQIEAVSEPKFTLEKEEIESTTETDEPVNDTKFSLDKSEEAQAEEVRAEEVKVEEVKTEGVKAEEVKTEGVKAEEVKAEDVRAEEIKTEEAQAEEVKEEAVEETAETQSDSAEVVTFEYEPILDLNRLNSFNSLIESDKDIVNTMYSELLYYRESIAKLSNTDVVLRLSSLDSQIKGYQNKIKNLEKEVELAKTDDSKLKELQTQLAEVQEKYTRLQTDSSSNLDALRTQLQTELDKSKVEVASLQKQLDNRSKNSNSTIDKLQQDLNKSVSENQKKDELLSKSQNEKDTLYENSEQLFTLLSQLSVKYTSLFERHNQEVERVQATIDKYKEVLKEKVALEEKITNLELEKKIVENKLNENERLSNLKYSDFEKAQSNLQNQLKEETNKNQALSLEIESLNANLESSDRQKKTALGQVDGLLAQINDKNTLLDSKDAMLSDLQAQLDAIKRETADVIELKEQVQVSDIAHQELQKEIGRLQIMTREQTREMEQKDKRIGELTKANADLQRNAKALSRTISTGSKLELFCKYSGHGFIIPIFSSGSYGTTTTSVSVAKKLHEDGNNVLLMDLDLVNPKCNSYFGLPALFSQDVGTMTGLQRRTDANCVSILMQKGVDYFLQERSNFIQNINTNRKTAKKLDFFNGLVGEVEVYKFANIDWDQLMNTLGNQYDYIVLDLGRFGGSNEQMALIKMFTNMSLRYLAITPKDFENARNLLLRMSIYQLDKSKLVWLFNLATDTGLDTGLTKMVEKIPYRIITFNSNLYGSTKLFSDAIFKGQFTSVVDVLTMKDMK